MPNVVLIGRWAARQLERVPSHIIKKLQGWVVLVETRGLAEARRIPGFHDEPLRGQRTGQRSIRLNQAYRAIYTVSERGDIELVTVEEVNKHDY